MYEGEICLSGKMPLYLDRGDYMAENKVKYMQDKEDAMVSKIEKLAESFSEIDTEELFKALQALIDEDEDEE